MWNKTSEKKPRPFEFVLVAISRDSEPQIAFLKFSDNKTDRTHWTNFYHPIPDPLFWMSFSDLPPFPE